MRSGGGCLQTYLFICASDRKQFVTVFVRAYALSAMIIPARVFAVGPDLPLILPHLFNRIRAFLELQLSTRLRRHRSKCKRDEVNDTEKGRRSDPGRIEQNAPHTSNHSNPYGKFYLLQSCFLNQTQAEFSARRGEVSGKI